jgi:hypothetical protein
VIVLLYKLKNKNMHRKKIIIGDEIVEIPKDNQQEKDDVFIDKSQNQGKYPRPCFHCACLECPYCIL